MDRKATYVVKWWLLGVLVFTTLMPGPVGAQTSQMAPFGPTTTFLPLVQKPSAAADGAWPMAGANPQRTSWTPEEVTGNLKPEWYAVIEPYIPNKVQIIAANDLIYVSTARGLYAFYAASSDPSKIGTVAWVFPTELPLGHSPTIANGIAYFGGFDKKLYAINAVPDITQLPVQKDSQGNGVHINNQVKWVFEETEGGFDTNPLVAGNLVYAGNRDGFMYAVNITTGQLAWKYQTGAPIHFSAAYGNNTIYFASNDMHAYALNAATGASLWSHSENGVQKDGSEKLPGDGFNSYWPVIYQDKVIFPGSTAYRPVPPWGWPDKTEVFEDFLTSLPSYPNNDYGPRDSNGLDASAVVSYLQNQPYRRTYFVLNASNGQEQTYDLNNDGTRDYAPISYFGTHAGVRFPPVIANNGLPYQSTVFKTTSRGYIAGWKVGTKYIVAPTSRDMAGDEPLGYSSGGNLIYWNLCCDRASGSFNVTTGQTYSFWGYGEDLNSYAPGYSIQTTGSDYGITEAYAGRVFGNNNGVYGYHGDNDPPIPYKGKIYMHRSNAVLAFSVNHTRLQKPKAGTVAKTDIMPQISTQVLTQKLETEISKILGPCLADRNWSACHLRPGYGIDRISAQGQYILDNMADYGSNPADTILALSKAYPYLSTTTQQNLKEYLQSEFAKYSPCDMTHIGWNTGAAREIFDIPPEISQAMPNSAPSQYSTMEFARRTGCWTGPDWSWTPQTFYALWKYAKTFGNASSIFTSCQSRFTTPPADAILEKYPYCHNAWIAGTKGYVELAKLAGNSSEANAKQALYSSLLAKKITNLTKTLPNSNWWGGPDASYDFRQGFAVARQFLFMTPELASAINSDSSAFAKAQLLFTENITNAPYWFVNKFEATHGEGVFQHLYDVISMFSAKAMILKEPREELIKYLDVPAFARGDLFYIQNLVAAIEADSTPPTSSSIPGPTAVDDASRIHNADAPLTANDLNAAESCKGYWPDMSELAVLHFNAGICFWGR
jgi:hypothetical protein